jgi:predicted 3-demethylubiquinone-9 3-methyltransferase (glyoxalase superfamily)
MSAKGPDSFNMAISLMIVVDTQAEIDKLWEGLSEGGQKLECGWVRDKYGVSWQITPALHLEMMKDKDPAKVKRVTEAMLKMQKFVIADLQKAYDGK